MSEIWQLVSDWEVIQLLLPLGSDCLSEPFTDKYTHQCMWSQTAFTSQEPWLTNSDLVVSSSLWLHGPCQNTGVGSRYSPGDLPNSGIENRCPTLQADSLPAKPPGTWCILYRAWDPNIHFFPEPQTLFGNRISVGVILWDDGVPDPITCILIKKPRGDTDTNRGTPTMWRWRKKLGTVLPQAREHQRLLASTRS